MHETFPWNILTSKVSNIFLSKDFLEQHSEMYAS